MYSELVLHEDDQLFRQWPSLNEWINQPLRALVLATCCDHINLYEDARTEITHTYGGPGR